MWRPPWGASATQLAPWQAQLPPNRRWSPNLSGLVPVSDSSAREVPRWGPELPAGSLGASSSEGEQEKATQEDCDEESGPHLLPL